MSDSWWLELGDDRPRLLARLRALLGEHTGLKFPPERWSNVERAAELVGKQQGFNTAARWLEWFMAGPPTLAHLEPLIAHLTIGETYFFRDKALFDGLREMLLPRLIEQRRASSRCLRFWSAGCSTGEEPYSIAITLQRQLPDWRDWHISLLASDINPLSLAKARAARYDGWSFRGGLPKPHDTAFEPVDAKSFMVAPQVRAMVRFEQLNLVDTVYPSVGFEALDIIFCRNVLMYLDPPRARAVIERLSAALIDGGWLILSAVEASLVDTPHLQPVRFGDLLMFQKCSGVHAALPMAHYSAQSAPSAAPTPPRSPAATATPIVAPLPAPPRAVAAALVPLPQPAPAAADAAPAVAAMIALARSNADNGRLSEAAEYCATAIAADKLNPEWTDLHASILLEQGAVAAAETALKRTLYLDPNRVLTHVKLANLLWREARRRAEGRRHFRTALELLDEQSEQEILQDTDGMTVAQLRTIIQTAVAHDVAGTYGKSA